MTDHLADEIKKSQREAESRQAKQEIKDSYETIRTDLGELARSVKRLANSEFGDQVSQIQEGTQQRIGRIEQQIREKPTQAALIAAGVGFLVGLLVVR